MYVYIYTHIVYIIYVYIYIYIYIYIFNVEKRNLLVVTNFQLVSAIDRFQESLF